MLSNRHQNCLEKSLQGYFPFFKILIFQTVRRVKVQKMDQNGKETLSVMPYISGIIHRMIFICGMLVYKDISRVFYIFPKFWFLWSVVGWKGKEWPKMIKKKLCLSCLISQEPYIIWSSVMVHKCKGYLQGFLHFFQILIFRVISWVKGQKMAQNDKNSVCLNLYHSNFASYDVVFCTNWVKWWYL